MINENALIFDTNQSTQAAGAMDLTGVTAPLAGLYDTLIVLAAMAGVVAILMAVLRLMMAPNEMRADTLARISRILLVVFIVSVAAAAIVDVAAGLGVGKDGIDLLKGVVGSG